MHRYVYVIMTFLAVVVRGRPGEVGLDVPEEIEGQLASFFLASHMLTVLGLPQLICKSDCQVVFTDMLFHLHQYKAIMRSLTSGLHGNLYVTAH